MQSRLARENNEQAMRADVYKRDMEEMRKGLLELQVEGRRSQEELEASMASINDLIKQRQNFSTRACPNISNHERKDRQVDERLKLISDMMQRRDSKAYNRMIDPMTTMQALTLGVKAIVLQTAAAPALPASAPLALNLANIPSTSAVPHQYKSRTEK